LAWGLGLFEGSIRPATVADADSICVVLRRSIIELCEPDHRNDKAILDTWLANKTPENIATWLANPNNVILVAEREGDGIAVGALTKSGEINLNYVSPDARFSGVSKAMMAALEVEARRLRLAACTLNSTQTAHRFYLSLGYVSRADMGSKHGADNFPMIKKLEP
jgi:GNAT superfamily N-acetyltransferase